MKIDIKSVYINPKDYWKNTNPIMPKGIIACEEETNKWKLCDGSRAYNDLPYVSDESGDIEDVESITDAKIKELVAKHEKDIKNLDETSKTNAANIESVDMNLATFETTTNAALATKADKAEVETVSTKLDKEIKEVSDEFESYKTDIDGFKSDVEKSFENVYSSEEIDEKLKPMVSYQDFVRNGETRKTIQLANYDNISGVATNGTGHNLVMLSKWDVADFGATGVHMNLNTKDTVTINDDKVVATLNDLENKATKEDVALIKSLIKSLSNKTESTVTNANSISGETITINDGYILNDVGTLTKYTATDGDVACSNLYVEKATLECTAKKGNVTLSNIKSSGNVEDKTVNASRNGLSIYANENVVINNSELYQDGYNMVHVNMNGTTASKNVTVENCKFGKTLNNGIIVFATGDNAVITIKDVTIEEAKNAVRFSNFLNKSNITVNLENVEVGSVREKFMLLEDYRTRKEVDGVLNYPNDSTDIFDGSHMTFNFKNVTVGGVKLTADMDKSEYLHMVVGKPSLGADIDVTASCKDGLVINFVD